MSHKTFCDSNFQLYDPQKSLCLFQEPKDRDQAGSIYCYQVMVASNCTGQPRSGPHCGPGADMEYRSTG